MSSNFGRPKKKKKKKTVYKTMAERPPYYIGQFVNVRYNDSDELVRVSISHINTLLPRRVYTVECDCADVPFTDFCEDDKNFDIRDSNA